MKPGKPKILLVDDEESFLAIHEMLLGPDFEIVSLQNPIEAMDPDLYKDEAIRAIVVDLMMPQASGLVVLEWMKTHAPHVRRIILSNMDIDTLDKIGALTLSDCALKKPPTLEQIYEAVLGA